MDAGVARLQIPIVTNPSVHFVLGKQRQRWSGGELFYCGGSFPHSLWNHGEESRIQGCCIVSSTTFC
jgi:hypothetical protein